MKGLNKGCLSLGLFSMLVFANTSCLVDGVELTTNEVLPEYQKGKEETKESQIEQGKFSIYFDLSDGMKYAYENGILKDYLSDITNKVNGDWNVYGLVTGEIEKISERGGVLYNRINNEPYTDVKAPIEKSMKDIVANNRPSLLVSDLEEYQVVAGKTEIQHRVAYAKDYFSQWVKNGGEVFFFVMDYQEPVNSKKNASMKDKHLFFVAFDNSEREVRKFVEVAIANRSKRYKTFALSNNTFSLSTEYPKSTVGGGYHDSKGEDVVSNVNDENNPRYDRNSDVYKNAFEERWEFYPCFESWENILKNSKDMQDAGVPRADHYKHFLSKLFITFENEDSYKVQNLDITVTNVQADFESYKLNKEATKYKPTVSVVEGETIVDFASCPNSKGYYNEKGDLLSDYLYNPKEGVKVLDMFDVSMNPTDTKNRYEICVDFSDKFTGNNNNVEQGDLLKIDIKIGETQMGDVQNIERYFVWQDVDDKNEGIYQSILNTLNDPEINPKGKLVYTYYVRAY